MLAAEELHLGEEEDSDVAPEPEPNSADARKLRGIERLAAIARQRGAAVDGRLPFYLHPENVPVFRLWGQVQTQWVHGMAGPTGFNWPSLREHPAVVRIPRRRREQLLAGLAHMEGAWIAERARIAAAQRDQSV